MNKAQYDELQDWLEILEQRLTDDKNNARSGFAFNHALKMLTHFKEFRAQLEQTTSISLN